MIKFCSIASGSNGNCIFVSYHDTKILIDAGLSGKRVEMGLNSINDSCHNLDAILITHEHSDHVMGAGVLSRRYGIPIFATPGTWEAMERQNVIGAIQAKNKRYIYRDEALAFDDICIHPFSIPHDAQEPVGYSIYGGNHKVVVATDIGHVTQDVQDNLKEADIVLLESNHDVEMLKNGRYPYPLKQRVLGQNGHLSNVTAGELIKDSFSKKLKHVLLGHLSEENNRPMLAYETVFNILDVHEIPVNKEFQLHVAKRGSVSDLIELSK